MVEKFIRVLLKFKVVLNLKIELPSPIMMEYHDEVIIIFEVSRDWLAANILHSFLF